MLRLAARSGGCSRGDADGVLFVWQPDRQRQRSAARSSVCGIDNAGAHDIAGAGIVRHFVHQQDKGAVRGRLGKSQFGGAAATHSRGYRMSKC